MRTLITTLTLTVLLTLPVLAWAHVHGSEFDDMPTGPYMGPALIGGDPSTVSVVPAGSLGGSTPPGATGNVLAIDNRNGNGPVTITFTYDCGGPTPMDICEIEYDFFYEAWTLYAWIGVYVDDDGSFENPDDLFEPPVGFPPSTSYGDNTEREMDCVGMHTITFVVGPGAVAYLDNFETECLEVIPADHIEWDALKSLYR